MVYWNSYIWFIGIRIYGLLEFVYIAYWNSLWLSATRNAHTVAALPGFLALPTVRFDILFIGIRTLWLSVIIVD